MNNTHGIILLVSILIAGCAAQTKHVELHSAFNAAEIKKLQAKGDNSITGSALIRTKGGGAVTCAGFYVTLVPLTNYSKERVIAVFGNDQKGYNPVDHRGKNVKFSNDQEGYKEMMKSIQCDAQGHFEFQDIADGSFYVITHIVWDVTFRYKQGGTIMQRVDLSNGENKNIVLSP